MKQLENTSSEQPSLELIEKWASQLNLSFTRKEKQCFRVYLSELRQWTRPLDLLASQNWLDIAEHCLDSISLLGLFCPLPQCLIVDLGSGGGFPGIPLKIFLPQVEFHFLESNKKKSGFLKRVIAKINLARSNVVTARAEEHGWQARGFYDLVLSRAVSPLNVLVEYSLPLLKVGGYLVAYKGKRAVKEIEESQAALEKLGGEVDRLYHYHLPLIKNKERTLVLVKKMVITPKEFPRRTGVPRKKPLS